MAGKGSENLIRDPSDELFEKANVPWRWWRVRREELPSTIRNDVVGYVKNIDLKMRRGESFAISGDVGSGKSTAMGYLAMCAIVTNFSVWWTQADRLRDSLRNRRKVREEISVAEWIYRVDVLAIDNVMTSDLDDRYYGWASILKLVQTRSYDRKPTFLTFDPGCRSWNGIDVVRQLEKRVSPITVVITEGKNLHEAVNEGELQPEPEQSGGQDFRGFDF